VSTDPILARLAAANPFPADAPHAPVTHDGPSRRILVAALAAVLVAVPAIAFADDVGGLFGFSTQGQTVVTGDTPFSKISGLAEASSELGLPSTMQLVATRDGIDFYAARRSDGYLCFAIDAAPGSDAHKGLGCDLGNPSLPGTPAFPSPARPIFDFSRFSDKLAGFAADGVATVDLLDSAGNVIDSVPVTDNVYADANPPGGGAAIEALDASGAVVYKRSFDEAP
jgi:hypothetical protein